MGIRVWDYGCSCGKEYRSYPVIEDRTPETIQCECGKRAGWIMAKTNGIHSTISTLYGNGVDPQYGEEVQSYDHKKRLQKEKGMGEVSGPEHIDDIMADAPEQAAQRPVDVGVADTVEDLMKDLYNDPRVDKHHTGAPRALMEPDIGF